MEEEHSNIEEEKQYRLLAKPIRSNVNITWEREGKKKKIKVKKRIQRLEERAQLKKQWDEKEAVKNANKHPPEIVQTLDMRTPEEKLAAARKKLAKMQTMGKMMKDMTMRKSIVAAGEEVGVTDESAAIYILRPLTFE